MVKKKTFKVQKPISAFFSEVQRSIKDDNDDVVIVDNDNTPSSSTPTTSPTSSSSRKRKSIADDVDDEVIFISTKSSLSDTSKKSTHSSPTTSQITGYERFTTTSFVPPPPTTSPGVNDVVQTKKKSQNSDTPTTTSSPSNRLPKASTGYSGRSLLWSSNKNFWQYAKLEEMIDNGWMIIPITNGCAFRATALQLYGSEDEHLQIRNATADHIYKEHYKYSNAILLNKMTVEDYIQDVRNPDIKADSTAIRAMTEVLNCRLVLCDYGKVAKSINNRIRLNVVLLASSGNGSYDLLVPAPVVFDDEDDDEPVFKDISDVSDELPSTSHSLQASFVNNDKKKERASSNATPPSSDYVYRKKRKITNASQTAKLTSSPSRPMTRTASARTGKGSYTAAAFSNPLRPISQSKAEKVYTESTLQWMDHHDFWKMAKLEDMFGNGWTTVKVEKGCIFRALSIYLYGDAEKHMELRETTATHIHQNREIYTAVIQWSGMKLNEYTNNIKKFDGQADKYTMEILAEVLKIKIVVYNYNNAPMEFNSSNVSKILFFAHCGDNQYDLLVPIPVIFQEELKRNEAILLEHSTDFTEVTKTPPALATELSPWDGQESAEPSSSTPLPSATTKQLYAEIGNIIPAKRSTLKTTTSWSSASGSVLPQKFVRRGDLYSTADTIPTVLAKGYKIKEFDVAISSFYQSIMHQLSDTNPLLAEHVLRKEAVSYIEHHPELFKPFIEGEDKKSFEEYIKHYKFSKKYADKYHIKALACFLNIKIIVFKQNLRAAVYMPEIANSTPLQTITLAYVSRFRYGSLYRSNNASSSDTDETDSPHSGIAQPVSDTVSASKSLNSTEVDKDIQDVKLKSSAPYVTDTTSTRVTSSSPEPLTASLSSSMPPPMLAPNNDLQLPSPTLAEIYPSAHSDLDKMLQTIQHDVHFVYGLFLMKLDETFDHCFYIGESNSPEDRLIHHRQTPDDNTEKYAYFLKYGRSRIRMVILHKSTMGVCMVLEKLLIQYASALKLTLTNRAQGYPLEIGCNVLSALRYLFDTAVVRNEGIDADRAKMTARRLAQHNLRNTKAYLNKTIENKLAAIESLGLAGPSISNFPLPVSSNNKEVINLPALQMDVDVIASNIAKLRSPYDLSGGAVEIADESTKLDPNTLAGTFATMTEEHLFDLIHDEVSATVFAARCGLIANSSKCDRCIRDRKLYTINNQRQWWVCKPNRRSTEGFHNGIPVFENTILKQTYLPGDFVFKAIFYVAHCYTKEQIASRFPKDFYYLNALEAFATSIRATLLKDLLKLCSSKDIDDDDLEDLFRSNHTVDHFGLLLSWIKNQMY